MPKVIGSADGYVVIDTAIRTAGLTKGVADIKGQFAGMAQIASKAGAEIQNSLTGSFSKSVELAKVHVQDLENKFTGVSAELASALAADDDSAAEKLGAKQEKIYDQIAVAREKLRIAVEEDAKKQAEAEKKAAEKAEKAHTKANKKSEKQTIRSSKTLRRFGTRLSGIAMSAFLFNSLSSGFRDISDYIGKTITSADSMRKALANLKGAAQQAAAPIIQTITPALTSLANGAATAVSYLSQLFAVFSGKSVSEMIGSAKALNQNAKAANKLSRALAGFDEINKLQENSTDTIEPNFDFVADPVNFLEIMKKQMLEGDWYGVGKTLTEKINEMLGGVDWVSVSQTVVSAVGGAFSFALGAIFNINRSQIMGVLNGIVAGLFKGLAKTIQNLDWKGIGGKLMKAFLKSVLLALAALNPALAILTILLSPNGDDVASGASEFIGSLIGALISAIVGMGEEIGRLSYELWTSIKGYFDKYVDWEDTPGEIIKGLFKGIADAITGVGNWIKKNIFDPFIKGFKEAFGIASPSKVMQEMGGFIMEGLFKGISDWLEPIQQIVLDVKKFFSDLWGGIEQGAKTAAEKVKEFFAPIGDFFKGIINGIIKSLNDALSWSFGGINELLSGLKDFKIAGVSPFYGVKTIKVPQIPYLASGAVIPPNAPYMAVLGDQRHGTNIEAPLDTIKQALAEVLALQGAGGEEIQVTVNFTGDLAQLARVLKPAIDTETRRKGTSLARGANY